MKEDIDLTNELFNTPLKTADDWKKYVFDNHKEDWDSLTDTERHIVYEYCKYFARIEE